METHAKNRRPPAPIRKEKAGHTEVVRQWGLTVKKAAKRRAIAKLPSRYCSVFKPGSGKNNRSAEQRNACNTTGVFLIPKNVLAY